jgi:hypothetical protein
MAALVAVVLFGVNAGRRRRFARRFFHEQFARRFGLWGVVLLFAAALLVVVARGVAQRRGWAPVSVYLVEAVLGVASLLRFHPLRSLVGFVLAVAVVVLVASDSHRARRRLSVNDDPTRRRELDGRDHLGPLALQRAMSQHIAGHVSIRIVMVLRYPAPPPGRRVVINSPPGW